MPPSSAMADLCGGVWRLVFGVGAGGVSYFDFCCCVVLVIRADGTSYLLEVVSTCALVFG